MFVVAVSLWPCKQYPEYCIFDIQHSANSEGGNIDCPSYLCKPNASYIPGTTEIKRFWWPSKWPVSANTITRIGVMHKVSYWLKSGGTPSRFSTNKVEDSDLLECDVLSAYEW